MCPSVSPGRPRLPRSWESCPVIFQEGGLVASPGRSGRRVPVAAPKCLLLSRPPAGQVPHCRFPVQRPAGSRPPEHSGDSLGRAQRFLLGPHALTHFIPDGLAGGQEGGRRLSGEGLQSPCPVCCSHQHSGPPAPCRPRLPPTACLLPPLSALPSPRGPSPLHSGEAEAQWGGGGTGPDLCPRPAA